MEEKTKAKTKTVAKKEVQKASAKVTTAKKANKQPGEKATSKKVTSKKTTEKSVPSKESDTIAVIKLSGVQLKVKVSDKYEVNKLDGNKGDKIEVSDVLLVAKGEDVKVGTPLVAGAKVLLTIDSQKKGDKVTTFQYKAKARYRRRIGNRPFITRVLVEDIKA